MSQIYDVVLFVLPRLPLWFIFSIPIFIVLYIVRKLILKIQKKRFFAHVIFSLVSSVLLAPLPVGMFLAFAPNGYMLLGGTYDKELLDWLMVSYPITLISFYLATYKFIVPFKPRELSSNNAKTKT